jgi:hypothetical protein
MNDDDLPDTVLIAPISISTEPRKWFENYDNVLVLGNWLVDNCDIYKCEDLLHYFEKPWKWEAEWEAMIQETLDRR